MGFPNGSMGKEFACNSRDTGDSSSIPGLGRSPGGGNGKPLQYSCLKNPMDRRATVKRVTKSQMQLSMIERCALQVNKKDIKEHIVWGGDNFFLPQYVLFSKNTLKIDITSVGEAKEKRNSHTLYTLKEYLAIRLSKALKNYIPFKLSIYSTERN